MLVSGAAGGDVDRGLLKPLEQAFFTVLVVASALLWSVIIASFCDVRCRRPFEPRMRYLCMLATHACWLYMLATCVLPTRAPPTACVVRARLCPSLACVVRRSSPT